MTEFTAFPLIQKLQSTLTSSPPYCSGVLEVAPVNFELYYGRNDARFIDLLEASRSNDSSAVERLAQGCERAKFGRGEETVLDETYRKAGKMDTTNFSSRLDLESTHLLDTVRLGLIPRAEEARTVRAELYKLNVYGEGAFFKPHKDTPHSQSMFGSLVVIFPTPHQGGALVLRHEGEEFTFDAAALLAGRTSSIAYVAFYSDVEHEVMPIVSGHRVTLTYNLYYGSLRKPALPTNLEVEQPPHASAPTVKEALSSLLEDATFLPEGGALGFGLRHDYPLPHVWTGGNPLESLQQWLKGSDAVLFRACEELGVQPLLRLVSERMDSEIMLDYMLELEGYDVEDGETELRKQEGAVVLHSFTFTGKAEQPWAESRYSRGGWRRYKEEEEEEEEHLTVHWVTSGGYGEGPCSPYVTYGNEASLNWLYMRVCLVVKIGPYGRRSKGTDDDDESETDENNDGGDGARDAHTDLQEN